MDRLADHIDKHKRFARDYSDHNQLICSMCAHIAEVERLRAKAEFFGGAMNNYKKCINCDIWLSEDLPKCPLCIATQKITKLEAEVERERNKHREAIRRIDRHNRKVRAFR